jgi:hypothetical protein
MARLAAYAIAEEVGCYLAGCSERVTSQAALLFPGFGHSIFL